MAVAHKRGAFEEWLRRRLAVAYEKYREENNYKTRVVRSANRDTDAREGVRDCTKNFEEKNLLWNEMNWLQKGRVHEIRGGRRCNGGILRSSERQTLLMRVAIYGCRFWLQQMLQTLRRKKWLRR